MSSTSNNESSESGVILFASLLTSIKRIRSFKKTIGLFNDKSNNSSCVSTVNGDKIIKKSITTTTTTSTTTTNGFNGYNGFVKKVDSNFNQANTLNENTCQSKYHQGDDDDNDHDHDDFLSSNSNRDDDTDDTVKLTKSLCKVTDVPSYLQFNPFILTGYRKPCMTSYDCLKSLLYFHNETINIMTHGKCYTVKK